MDFQWNEDLLYEFMNSLWSNDRFKKDDFIRELEYFKKSKEQEGYEILSLKYEKDKKVYPFTYLPNGVYIYSVKRLSDGEVFRVGDLVKWNLERNDQTPFLIESFEENHMHPFEDRMFCNNKNIDICYLEKVKKVLFTTDDNFIVYENDGSATSIVYDDFSFNYRCRIEQVLGEIKIWGRESLKLFSTKEVAEDWIIMNKPVLSVRDIHDYFDSWVTKPNDYLRNKIVELAKSKLEI